MKHLTYQALRDLWRKFFEKHDHKWLESHSLLNPDESLLWINSGVAGLKDYFLAIKTPPKPRLVNIQKSVRTNDLTLIGKTNRHLTLFEMMGNFSLGDYFKSSAIKWAWEFLTAFEWLNLDRNKLYFTVWKEDLGTQNILKTELKIDNDHILLKTKKTNFWDLGVGPCGPNMEIFYDLGVDFDPKHQNLQLLIDDIENDRYLEIWNIVFTEYNNIGQNQYLRLKNSNIDTGLGLERILMILQNRQQLFATDIFMPLINFLELNSKKKFTLKANQKLNSSQKLINTSFGIIIDHLRAAVFMLGDLLAKSNYDFSFQNQHGYIVRRLLRNAFIQLDNLKLKPPFLYQMVDLIVDQFKTFYPVLKQFRIQIKNLILNEERQIIKLWKPTLIAKLIDKDQKNLTGKAIFELVTSRGIPLELIENYALQKELNLDLESYYQHLTIHKKVSHHGNKTAFVDEWSVLKANSSEPTLFLDQSFHIEQCHVLAVFPSKASNNQYWVIFNQTPFYAEKGGQASDTGKAVFPNFSGQILNVQLNHFQQHVHLLASDFKPQVGDVATLIINEKKRLSTAKNHSSTHLLHYLLRKHFGTNLKQSGSFNNDQYLRLDFNFDGQINLSDLELISQQMADLIAANIQPEIIKTTLANAQKMQVLAFFTDRYQNPIVRIVKFGDFSLELCGGTHVFSTSKIERFLITNFQSISKRKWRIYAITGKTTVDAFLATKNVEFKNLMTTFKPEINTFPKLKSLLKTFQATTFYLIKKSLFQQIQSFNKLIKTSTITKTIQSSLEMYQIPKQDIFLIKKKLFCIHKVDNLTAGGLNFLRALYDKNLQNYQLVVLIFINSSTQKNNLFIKLTDDDIVNQNIIKFLQQDSQIKFGIRKNRLQGVISLSTLQITTILKKLKILVIDLFTTS